jgi:hypothetical protein
MRQTNDGGWEQQLYAQHNNTVQKTTLINKQSQVFKMKWN